MGCYSCIKDESKCPFFEEKSRITKAMEEADCLIFTTPTYCMRASAQMKSFLDLTFTYWMIHKPRASMFRKRAVIVSTAAGAGAKSAVKDIAVSLEYCGVPFIKKYGIGVQAMGWEGVSDKKRAKIEKDAGKIAAKLSDTRKPHVGIKTKAIFLAMRMMQKGNMGAGEEEHRYWQEKGWLDKARPWKD